ncbi:hypothetical protein ES707_10793 [subsurface metagenome]
MTAMPVCTSTLALLLERAAEERSEVAIGRERHGGIEAGGAAGNALRGIAAVGEAEVVVELVGQLDLGVVGRLQRHGRIEAVTLEVAVVAEGVAVLVEGVQPDRDVLVTACPASSDTRLSA